MKHSIFIIIILLTTTRCKLFSDDGNSKAMISVNHLAETELPLICEGDQETIPALTDSVLSKAKLNSEIAKAIKDSIANFFLIGKMMSSKFLSDEVLFPKHFFSEFWKESGIDSVKITLTRDLSDMSFNGYAFISEAGNERVKTELLDNDLNKWLVSINGISNTVTIKENLKTKDLFLLTSKGDTISFQEARPSRCYLSPIKFVEAVKLFYSNGKIYTTSANSNNLPTRGNLLRVSDDLSAAKKI